MHTYELTFPDRFVNIAWEYGAKGVMAVLMHLTRVPSGTRGRERPPSGGLFRLQASVDDACDDSGEP